MHHLALRRAGAFVLVFATLVQAARATWSVVAVDTLTREVCVSSATCLANFNLKRNAAVVVPGYGGAMAQSWVDADGTNRMRIFAGILAGEEPSAILAATNAADTIPERRQYGIVTLDGEPVTFTGAEAGLARFGVAGQIGRFKYAIQGNLLTGDAVVSAAEVAFRTTEGDISARVMAAMEAAAALGGDGRCSCGPAIPTACGAPPPMFNYSAFTGFLTLARSDDPIGPCNSGTGCAASTFTIDLNVISEPGGVEPVEELRVRYDAWRAAAANRPHPVLTLVEPQADALVADGRSTTFVRILPTNIDGERISPGALTDIEVAPTSPGPPVALAGPPGWHGFDRFGFLMTATDQPGTGTWSVTLVQGLNRERLFPDLELRVDPLAPLHVGHDELLPDEAANVPFHLNLSPADAGREYLLLGSASGTSPGTPFGGALLPLAYDGFLRLTFTSANGPRLVDTRGTLDANGRARAELRVTPGMLAPWAPGRLDWAALVPGSPARVLGPVGFELR